MKADERELVLEQFKNNDAKYLVAVDALNAGFNVPEVDSAICTSGVSTELVAVQQLGRTARYQPDKFAIFINLYGENTVEEKWVKKKNANLKNVWLNDLNQLKKWLEKSKSQTP